MIAALLLGRKGSKDFQEKYFSNIREADGLVSYENSKIYFTH